MSYSRLRLVFIIVNLAYLLCFAQLKAMEKDEEIDGRSLSSRQAPGGTKNSVLETSLIEDLPNEVGMHIIRFLIPKNILGTDQPYSYLNLPQSINLKDILAIQQISQRLNILSTAVLRDFVKNQIHPHEIMCAQSQVKCVEEIDWKKLALTCFFVKQAVFLLKNIYSDGKNKGFMLLKKAAEQGSIQAHKKIISKALPSFLNKSGSTREGVERQALMAHSQLKGMLAFLPLKDDEKAYLKAKYDNLLLRHSFLIANHRNFQMLNLSYNELYNVFLMLGSRGHPRALYTLHKFWPYTFLEENKVAVLQSAADAGYAPAQNKFGVELKQKGDKEGAKYYFRLAAQQKHAAACYNLKCALGEEGNIAESMDYNSLAVSLGFTQAFYDLGSYLHYVKKDIKAAEKYYWLAAVQGHPYAQQDLGKLYYHAGELSIAQHFLLSAAEKNLPIATLQLAFLLFKTGDKERATHYFRLVSDQGECKIQYELGIVHLQEGKIGQAAYYFQLSADQEFVPAIYVLGKIYYDKEDLLLSKYYMKKAAANHYADAQTYLKLIKSKEKPQKQTDPLLLRINSISGSLRKSAKNYVKN